MRRAKREAGLSEKSVGENGLSPPTEKGWVAHPSGKEFAFVFQVVVWGYGDVLSQGSDSFSSFVQLLLVNNAATYAYGEKNQGKFLFFVCFSLSLSV